MSQSIESRVRLTALSAVLLSLTFAGIGVVWAYSFLERAVKAMDIKAERKFFIEMIRLDEPLNFRSASTIAHWVPDRQSGPDSTPNFFREFPFPFTGEVHVGRYVYMIEIAPFADGRLYLAKDISIYEQQDHMFKAFIWGLSAIIIALAAGLSFVVSRRLLAPLASLTRQIASIVPSRNMPRINEDNVDREMRVIIQSFNKFLVEIESFVVRERAMIGMASHELRTPIAVMAGALDGIEDRGLVAPADLQAVARIRRAVTEMGATVDGILALSRRTEPTSQPLQLQPLLEAVLAEATDRWKAAARVAFVVTCNPLLHADPVLAKILVRNLIHNALQHTTGPIQVHLDRTQLEVSDKGQGFSTSVMQPEQSFMPASSASAGGLGLYIANLIVERLDWTLHVASAPELGTTFRLEFGR